MDESSFPGDCQALEQAIERRIDERTCGRLRNLRVHVGPDRVIVHGFTSTYYLKQLALQGALDVVRPASAVPIEMDVQVGTALAN